MQIPNKISYTDFIIFFQKNFETLFKEQQMSYVQQLPTVALALRLTVDLFRVLSSDQKHLSINNLVTYMNNTELCPLTLTQVLVLFEIYGKQNLESAKTRSYITSKRKDHDCPDQQEALAHLKLRSYNLLDFIKKFMRPIEKAVNRIGLKFI